MNTICKLYKRVAYSHTGPKSAVFTRLRCKQWSCEYCAAKNASIWRAFLKEKLPEISNEWWLLTLTAHPNTTTQQNSLNNIRKNIDKLIKRAKRVFGKLSYCRTYERHPTSRRVHAHFIVSGLSPFVAIGCNSKCVPSAFACLSRPKRAGFWSVRTWFKINAQECKIGMIADIRLITGEPLRAVLYVCKYLTKSQQDLHVKGLRHVQTTRDIGSPKTDKDMEWRTASYIMANMFAPNASIVDINTGEIIDNSYWEIHNFYPYDD